EQDWVGIQVENSSGLADSLGLIANNVIHVNTNVTASGFWVKNSTYQRIYFNSIHITGNAEDSRCIYHEGGSGKNIYLKNNILSNIAGGFSIVTYNHPGLESDYNDLYTDRNRFININGTTPVDNLANWQSGYNQDLHSYSVDPKFVSDTDLHANNIHLDGSGLPLTEVTVDFEGDQRDPANPDIGADEFDGCSMSGTYTIGLSGADYTSFETAVEALSNCRVTGPVFFNVQSGTYNEQVVIPEIIDASETNTITFRSASGDSTDVTLTYESVSQDTNYTVKLNGADYLKFENLTIQATGNDYAKVIEITNGATNNRFSNNKFTGVNTTDGSEANGALIYSPDGSALEDTCNIFSENLFQSGSHGIVLRGGSSYIENGNQIIGNYFEDQVSYGIYLYDQKDALISQNHISNLLSENDYYGIYVSGESIIINKNEIDINNANSNVRGIYVTNISSSLNNLISNNFVHIHSTGTGHVAGTEPGNYCLVYYNSINITGDRTGSYAANLQFGYNNIFKNNIFLNNAGGYAIGDYNGISINNTSDYNNIYSNGEYLGVYNSSNLVNLQEWTATTLLDSNSISIDPEFISDSDLHTINKNLKAGTPLPDVDDDIDGETRDATTPFIGADEYLFTPSSKNDILSFSFAKQTGTATIDAINHTVDIEVIYGTDVTGLVATFSVSDWATIAIGATLQESGVTSNDFTSSVTYTVTAEDGTQQDWIVTVTVATTQSSENDILSFSFAEQTGTATIDATNHIVDIEVAYG
ncbi:MAG: right-handed parallel beta-helix repeat-containing protein, partial [Bacteroidales bacterium]|nr:right-handed parallel beta-helix repeat-containing protein [Bacteroidales bacterium]